MYLAEKAGVAVEEYSSRNPEEEREINIARDRLRKLNEDAMLWFHQMLLRAKEATAARAYVQSRGISTDSVISFSLGYAPDKWDSLSRYLLSEHYYCNCNFLISKCRKFFSQNVCFLRLKKQI